MADNVPITAGSGTSIAADDVSSVFYQKVKLDGGGDGVTLPIIAGAQTTANSLPVAIASDQSALPITDSQKIADNAGFTDGTTPVGPAGYILDETAGTALTENDIGAARMDDKRAQVVTIEDKTTRGRRVTVTAGGSLQVTAVNAGTFAVQDSANATDNAPFADGTSKLMMAGFVYDETPGTTLSEDDAAAGRVDLKRALVNVIEDATTRGQRMAVNADGSINVTASSGAVSTNNASTPWGNGTSPNSTLTLATGDYASILFVLIANSGVTGTPSVAFEASPDSGTTWIPVYAFDLATPGAAPALNTGTIAASQNARWRVPDAMGWTRFRLKITAVPSAGAVSAYIFGSTRGTSLPGLNVQPVSDNSGSITVDNGGTFAVQASQSTASNLKTAADLTLAGTAVDANSGNKSAGTVRVVLATDQPALTNALKSDITIGGTAVDGNSGNKSAQTLRTVIATDQPNLATALNTQGDVAHGASNSGSPIQNGYEAIAHGTNPSAVTAGQRTKAYANRAGIPFVMGGHPNVFTYQIHTTGALTDQAMGPAIGAGLKMVVTQMQVVTDNACTAFPAFRAGFGTANTPGNGSTTGQVGVVLSHPGLPAGGGISRGDGSGILGIGADNEELRVTCAAPTGGSLDITVSGYTIET